MQLDGVRLVLIVHTFELDDHFAPLATPLVLELVDRERVVEFVSDHKHWLDHIDGGLCFASPIRVKECFFRLLLFVTASFTTLLLLRFK